MNDAFPDNCLKGIPKEDGLTPEGAVARHIFYFEDNPQRSDGLTDQSINWEDDTDAIEFTLSQLKDGRPQFSVGIAVLPREEIDRLRLTIPGYSTLFYERHPLSDNRYHGNLLISASSSKPLKNVVAGALASRCQVIKRE